MAVDQFAQAVTFGHESKHDDGSDFGAGPWTSMRLHLPRTHNESASHLPHEWAATRLPTKNIMAHRVVGRGPLWPFGLMPTTRGQLGKFGVMLETGVPRSTVLDIMVREGVASSPNSAEAALARARPAVETKVTTVSASGGEVTKVSTPVESPPDDATNFFEALLLEASPEEEETPPVEEPPAEEPPKRFVTERRRRRSTSEPPKTADSKSSREHSLPPSLPPSPPLAEKLYKMLSETPSRFKSDKRLKTEQRHTRPSVARSERQSLTVPHSPALLTSAPRRARVAVAQVASTFKALALNPKIMTSSGDYGVPRVCSAPTTAPRPFALATSNRTRPARAKDVVSLAKENVTRSFHAKPPPKSVFRPARSTKPLTTPVAPNMPGLAFHQRARAKFQENVAKQRALEAQSIGVRPRKPMAALNSDVRAVKRSAYDSAAARRRDLRQAEKSAADAAVHDASQAQLARMRRTSIAQGGLQFVARDVPYV